VGIRSRFIDGDATARYILPEPILGLFEKVPAFGAVHDRPTFMGVILPAVDALLAIHEGRTFSARPAWMQYYNSPKTHVIVTGHVLICHAIKGAEFYQQPSVHLFSEDATERAEGLQTLLTKARSYGG
jgi:hypothetical protein